MHEALLYPPASVYSSGHTANSRIMSSRATSSSSLLSTSATRSSAASSSSSSSWSSSTIIHCICSCQSLWAIVFTTCMLLYTSELLHSSSSPSSCNNTSDLRTSSAISPGALIHSSNVMSGAASTSRAMEDSLSVSSSWVANSHELQQRPYPSLEKPLVDLLHIETAWNHLSFGSPGESPLTKKLRIAVFVRKWPSGGTPGGLERHALTLYNVLAQRGHEVHVFTMIPGKSSKMSLKLPQGKLYIHNTPLPKGAGYDQKAAWDEFLVRNRTLPFDVVHTESVALHHTRAQQVHNLVATWHGIAFEVIRSDIVQDLTRPANETERSAELTATLAERLFKVTDEIRFFGKYRHHVAISDYVGEVLRTVYELPGGRVHVILNGVNETEFGRDPQRGEALRRRLGVPPGAGPVLGVAGRLVKDKGHPLLVEALSGLFSSACPGRRPCSRCPVYVLVAGDGPWAARYRELSGHCVKALGPMTPHQMAAFYNAIHVFVDPTLRAQGLDLTLLEAMLCGTPLLATRFPSITRSIFGHVDGADDVQHPDVGFTFSPNVPSLSAALLSAIAAYNSSNNSSTSSSRQLGGSSSFFTNSLAAKGRAASRLASQVFTASKMGLAYERLFYCIRDSRYCQHPLPFDPPAPPSHQPDPTINPV